MATANQKSVAEEAVQCMICIEYDGFLKCDIKQLPCSHVLCTNCILNLHEISAEQHDCTTCRYVRTESMLRFIPTFVMLIPTATPHHCCLTKHGSHYNLLIMQQLNKTNQCKQKEPHRMYALEMGINVILKCVSKTQSCF